MNENDMLNQVLDSKEADYQRSKQLCGESPSAMPPQSPIPPSDFKQWGILPNEAFRPVGSTTSVLPSGVYRFDRDEFGIVMKRINVATDALLPLPDSANERVLVGMRKFWKMQVAYKSHGLLYKRGVLLWGPPGSGKTATISLLTAELVSMGGLVIYCQIPGVTSIGLEQLRRVEPNRKLICILEDIDEMMQMYGEHDLLALLDGENQVDNIVMVASTNYPERLGARIVNRPARFDERILVGMPSREARRVYLGRIASRLGRDDLSMWVNDTEGFSIAHLRELAAAVLCLEQPYEEVLSRLRSMRIMPKERDAVSSPVGFVPA